MMDPENKIKDNDGGEEEKPAEMESQFILRLPPRPAEALRAVLRRSDTKTMSKDKIKIELDPSTMRHATLRFDDCSLPAKIYDLPSVIESYKTFDKKVLYKVADICQIMKCAEKEELLDEGGIEDEDSSSGKPKVDRDGRDKRFLFPHGITPCLKNSRKRRFRKTLRKRHTEAPSVESEVKMLLKTDAEAISSRFELVEDDRMNDQKQSIPSSEEKENSKEGEEDNPQMSSMLAEYIFGDVSSSSDENADFSAVKMEDSKPMFDLSTMEIKDSMSRDGFDNSKSPIKEEKEDPEEDLLFSQQEAETAQQNLDHMLQSCTIDEDRTRSFQRLYDLECAVSSLQSQRESLECETLSIENQALKERCLDNIESLRAEEAEKKAEYDRLVASIQGI